MEQDILEQLYFGRIVPWENRNDKTPEMEQCSEQVYRDTEHLTQLLDEDGKKILERLMLNLHATFTKGTVEFRLFQFDEPTAERRGGIHAGQLKSYIQLCLALSQMAKDVRTASPKPQQNENPKYAMRTWLLRLGFIGEEFATARDFLTRNLTGDTAFRHGRAAA